MGKTRGREVKLRGFLPVVPALMGIPKAWGRESAIFLAGGFCAIVALVAWVWLHSGPERSTEDQRIYDSCLLERNGNTTVCDAMMRVIARERTAETAMLQQAAILRAAGFSGCEIERWASDQGFVGSQLSEASGIPLNELRAENVFQSSRHRRQHQRDINGVRTR
jgi:hypothetical protein